MGFEVNFSYYDKNKDGKGFDTSQLHTFKKVIGKTEDVPLDKLAKTVMMQLARRDILVEDVEVYEYTRKKISFKETKGGVIIKNQKFLLDQDEIVMVEEPEEVRPQQIQIVQQEPTQVLQKPSASLLGSKLQMPSPSQKALRMEVFDPDDPGVAAELAKKNIKVTPKKKYAIFEEKLSTISVVVSGSRQEVNGYDYLILTDDAKKEYVSSIHFVPEQRGLIGMPANLMPRPSGANLMYMGPTGDNDMPVLRRG